MNAFHDFIAALWAERIANAGKVVGYGLAVLIFGLWIGYRWGREVAAAAAERHPLNVKPPVQQ